MSKLALKYGGLATICVVLSACAQPQSTLTADDLSPIDHHKMTAFNQWLEDQKKLEPVNAFRARPMQVMGKGRVKAMPDIAVITGTITTEADNDDTAVDEAAKIINAVQASVKGQTIELNFTQIRTSEERDPKCEAGNAKSRARHSQILSDNRYNANIKRRLEEGKDIKIKPRNPKPRLATEVCPVTHIEAKLGFVARVQPANEAGNIINAFTTAGVKKVDLFGYDFSDYDALYKEASTKAVKDARTKAERIAKIAGTELTEIVSFVVDRPQRTTRFGPQAMIVTNHQNRNVAPGYYSGNDRSVLGGNYPQPVIMPPSTQGSFGRSPVYQEPVSEFTVFNGVQDEVVTTGMVTTSKTNEILARAMPPPNQSNSSANNALKMSLQAGQRTITVNAYLSYVYETPIDGTIVPAKVN